MYLVSISIFNEIILILFYSYEVLYVSYTV